MGGLSGFPSSSASRRPSEDQDVAEVESDDFKTVFFVIFDQTVTMLETIVVAEIESCNSCVAKMYISLLNGS